jgi:hypothetical protein
VSGISFSPENRDAYLIDNSFSGGIDSVYSGKLPGPHIAVSETALTFEIPATDPSNTRQVQVRNSGTGVLNIVANANANWLRVKINNSRIENEQQQCTVTIDADAAKLKKGTHHAEVAITDANTKQKSYININAIVK